MKVRDIANQYGIDQGDFEQWLVNSSGIPYKSGLIGGISIEDDAYVEAAVSSYQSYRADYEERAAQEAAERARAEQEAEQEAERERQAAEQEAERERQAAEQAKMQKQQAMASMLITSGFSFDGFKITKYSGYISGDDVVQIDRGSERWFGQATNVGDSLMNSLSKIRRNALAELKEAAYNLGCNAVIGVDFDYLTLDPETVNSNGGTLYLPYVFGVTANGNAVIIEKE
jgi:uncharacterized protein YbjQ (UPF0145 family)